MAGKGLAVAWLSVLTGLSGQDRAGTARAPSTSAGDWPHYTADIRGTKYSPLDQINAANFKTLEVAWRFKTDMLGPRPEYKLEGTPLSEEWRDRLSRASRVEELAELLRSLT